MNEWGQQQQQQKHANSIELFEKSEIKWMKQKPTWIQCKKRRNGNEGNKKKKTKLQNEWEQQNLAVLSGNKPN